MNEVSEHGELLYGDLTDAILADLRAGRQPDVAALAHRYPSLAGQFDGHIAQLAAILRAGAPPAGRLEVPVQLGDFRILREIGRGGMGVVYEAEQLSLNRRVALKVLPFATLLDPLRLLRFKNEAQAAARLHHPHIVPVFAVGCERGLHYYAMQLVDGFSAAVLVQGLRRQAGPTTPGARADTPEPALTARDASGLAFYRTVAKWGVQAAQALHYAHEVGVVHRDVKPANLLLDGGGDLWVTDFGLARLRGEAELTATGDAVGTLRYMSPEQALGLKGVADHRVDIYGLGATLYELLTRRPVLPGQDHGEMLRRLLESEPPPPRALEPGVPVDLETIVLKALRKEPAERYASAGELADDLTRFLDGQPIRARRPTRRQRLRRWVGRHAVGLGVAGAVLALLSLVLTASTLLTARAYREAAARQVYAERSRQVARRAVDQVLGEVVAGWLEHEGPVEPAQRRLLEQLLACCQELAREDGADVHAHQQVALAWFRAAILQSRLGRLSEALASNEKALGLLDRLSDTHPNCEPLLRAQGLNLQGRLLRQTGQLARAEQALRQALALLEPLAEDHADDPRYRHALAQALDQLATWLQSDRLRAGEAREPHRRAVEHFTALSRAHPQEQRFLYGLGHARANRAVFFSRTNERTRAEEEARQAITVFRRLHAGNRPSWLYREGLGQTLALLAEIRNSTHRPGLAEAPAREAVTLAAELARDFPGVPTFRRNHARYLSTLADVVGLLGRLPEAEGLARKAVAIAVKLDEEVPGVPAYRLAVADAKMQLGMSCMNQRRLAEAERWHGESVALLLRILRADPQDAQAHYLFTKGLPEVRGLQTVNRSFAPALAYHQAIEEGLTALVERQPKDRGWREGLGETYRFLGALYLCLGQPARAEEKYRRLGKVLEALAGPSVAAAPEPAYDLAWFLANCPVQACRNPRRARDLAQQLLRTRPGNNRFTRMVLADVCCDLGQYEQAGKIMWPLSLFANDAAVDLWIQLARVKHHQGKPAEARAALGRAARRVATWRRPLDLERLLLLAEVNRLLGEPEPVLKRSVTPAGTSPEKN